MCSGELWTVNTRIETLKFQKYALLNGDVHEEFIYPFQKWSKCCAIAAIRLFLFFHFFDVRFVFILHRICLPYRVLHVQKTKVLNAIKF